MSISEDIALLRKVQKQKENSKEQEDSIETKKEMPVALKRNIIN